MKKNLRKKLSLSRETVRALQTNGLGVIAGGATQTCSDDCRLESYCVCTDYTCDPIGQPAYCT